MNAKLEEQRQRIMAETITVDEKEVSSLFMNQILEEAEDLTHTNRSKKDTTRTDRFFSPLTSALKPDSKNISTPIQDGPDTSD